MNESENRCAVVNVRLKPFEKVRLCEEASLAGMTVSEFARRRFLGRTVSVDMNLAVIRELRRIGADLVALTESGSGSSGAEAREALGAIGALISRQAQREK